MPQPNAEMRECIDNCTRCHQVCLSTIQHCLQKGGRHAQQPHLRLMADCVQICAVSADFMLRGSLHHGHTCGVCAEICEDCARDCEAMGDDPEMKRCAEICHRCADSCRRMAGAMAH